MSGGVGEILPQELHPGVTLSAAKGHDSRHGSLPRSGWLSWRRSAPTPRAQPSAPGEREHWPTEASCSKWSRRRRETRRGWAVAAIATVEPLAATAAPDGLCA